MMRRSIGLAALFLLLGRALWPAYPEKERGPRFEPIQVVHIEEPVYPILSVGIGTVILEVAIDKSGVIEGIDVIHGIPSLTKEAERAVRKWKFQPAKLDGKPVIGAIIAAFAFSGSLFTGPSWAARPQEEKQARFKPIQIVSTIGAVYPFTSIASGSVTLEVTVDQAGAIDHIKVIHGIPSLTELTERTVRKWKFRPARVDDKPVVSLMIASFTFRIQARHR